MELIFGKYPDLILNAVCNDQFGKIMCHTEKITINKFFETLINSQMTEIICEKIERRFYNSVKIKFPFSLDTLYVCINLIYENKVEKYPDDLFFGIKYLLFPTKIIQKLLTMISRQISERKLDAYKMINNIMRTDLEFHQRVGFLSKNIHYCKIEQIHKIDQDYSYSIPSFFDKIKNSKIEFTGSYYFQKLGLLFSQNLLYTSIGEGYELSLMLTRLNNVESEPLELFLKYVKCIIYSPFDLPKLIDLCDNTFIDCKIEINESKVICKKTILYDDIFTSDIDKNNFNFLHWNDILMQFLIDL